MQALLTRKWYWAILFSLIANFSFSQTYHNEWINYSKTYYKFKVGSFGTDVVNGSAILTKGMVRIPYAAIAAAGLGNASSEQFQLWRDGEEVPVYITKDNGALGAADYIEFFGATNNGKLDKEMYRDPSLQLSDYWSLQTDTAAYFLTINTSGTNKRFANTSFDLSGNSLAPAPYFMHTVGRYFRAELLNGFSAVSLQSIYSSSYDMGEGYTSRAIRPNACGSQPQLPQNFFTLYPYLGTTEVPAPDMTMYLNSVGNAPNSRTIKVLLNNDSITTYQMDYFYDSRLEEPIPVSKIASGTAGFLLINQSTASCDQFRVSKIELTYPRQFNFDNATTFAFTLNQSADPQYLEIKNFNYGGVAPVIYDLANNKRYIGDISTSGTVKVLIEASEIPHNLVITSQAGTNYKTINTFQTRTFTNYALAQNQGDYLIISNPLIYGTGGKNYVEQYSNYRSSAVGGGYLSKIIDANELIDQFAWGIKKHPLSVKNFLAYARNTFAAAPKYVFLIGKGVAYNSYRSNEGNALADQLNLVPTWGYPASDNMLASADLSALPALPIGRLSAVTPDEVGEYLRKIKQYDSAQLSTDHTIEGRSWTKNVLQIAGANDLGLGNQLDGYMSNYKSIISDTAFGANVTNFSKNANPEGYTDAIISFKNIYEQGAALITYFGHSSSTSLDFNLDKPEHYNNESKYPVFIANGCNAGNNFDFETNRFNNTATISERFVLASQRGAIAYLATTSFGVVNYLNMYTTQFYRAFAKTKYNQSLGIAIQEGIRATLQSTGSPDFFSRVHAEQFALNGDPAIKLNSTDLPDYAVGEPQIEVSPSFLSVADTSYSVKVKVYNLGRSTIDPVSFKLNKVSPKGETTTLVSKQLPPLALNDSVMIDVKIMGVEDLGINKLIASVDYDNTLAEITEENNSATKEVLISEEEIRPVYPYNNGIVTSAAFKFQASTVNPLSEEKTYIMQIDTTDLFNSPLLTSKTVMSSGGVVEFEPAITLENNKFYYWRVSPVLAEMHWRKSSFVYANNAPAGFEQGHFYQHADATFTKMYIDSADRKFKFRSHMNNLFIVNSIFPTSGLEDSHFSVSVNGNMIIASACDGPVLQFNVFDPVTFLPWKNITTGGKGLYGSGPSDCALSRQYNFEFSTMDSANRRKAMQFMDMVPNGYYVVVRTVSSPDNNINTYAPKWHADTVKYGAGNSIYNRLKTAGFATLDSFYKARTFSFVYKKNDASFAPKYAMSDGINDRINLDVNCSSPDSLGHVTSIKYGPAKAWKKVKWAGSNIETNNDDVKLNVIGVNNNGEDTLLYSLITTQQDFDISAVDAAKYRFVKLDLESRDALTVTPYQLDYYKVEYDAAPEGGVAPNLYFNFPDTLTFGAGRLNSGTDLHLGVAFKNSSNVNFDSLAVTVILYDAGNVAHHFKQPKTKPLAAGDTLHVEAIADAINLNGLYTIYLEVNPDKDQPEQFSFNNFLYKKVYIKGGILLPVSLISFDAALQGTDVQTRWSVTAEEGVKSYEVQHSTNGTFFKTVGTIAAANGGAANMDYSFLHPKVPVGKNFYRLRITDNDGSRRFSAVRTVILSAGLVINIYPNPVKDVLTIFVSRPDGKASTVKLVNAFGQQLLQQLVSGTLQVNMSKYPSGMYLVQIDEGTKISTYKIQKQ